MNARRLFALGRIGAAMGGILLMSIQCGAPVDAASLHRFETCEDLERYLHDQVLHPRVETRAPRGASFVLGCAAEENLSTAPPGSSAGEGEGERGQSAPDEASEGIGLPVADNDAAGGEDGQTSAEREFTETNTQEEEVDEADFVKSDGEHLYVLRRGEMIIVDAWPAAEASVLSRTPLSGRPFAMFFDEGRALVAARDDGTVRAEWGGSVVLQLFDVSDKAAPALLRETRIDGSWVDARRVGDEVLILTRTQMFWPWLDRSRPFTDDENRALLEEHGLGNALPGVRDIKPGDAVVLRDGLAFQCHNTFAPDTSDGQNLVVVHTYPMNDDEAPLKSTGVVGNPEHVYASEHSIYLADTVWHDGGFFTPEYAHTRFHKLRAFASGDGAADYVGTGSFEGRLHNQFSMDEEEGRLRAVLTTNSSLSGAAASNKTSLVVIEEDGVALREVGRVDRIGDGEFVQAVRFLGSFAYVVTYPLEGGELSLPPSWRIPPPPIGGIWDPLFVIDLSDPVNPRKRGELEVAGYSTYIHPLGAEHLLTIGVDSDERGTVLGMALSVFDVADPDAPRLAHRQTFGDGLSFSEALTDHHAFTFFDARQALGIPMQLTDAQGRVTSTGLEVFHIDPEDGITPYGTIEQLGLYDLDSIDPWSAGCMVVRRSVMIAEGAETYVYALSTAGVTIASLEQGVPTVRELSLWNDDDGVCPFGTPL